MLSNRRLYCKNKVTFFFSNLTILTYIGHFTPSVVKNGIFHFIKVPLPFLQGSFSQPETNLILLNNLSNHAKTFFFLRKILNTDVL